jgi:DNA excision repair protein ERCC-4
VLWLAPTEGSIREYLTSLDESLPADQTLPWKTSSIPEKHGCDLIIPTKSGIIGFQRKTLPDLVASLQDGRLYYELNQINASATITQAFLCIESSFSTTVDNTQYTEANIPVATVRSIVAKFAHHGVGYLPTASPRDTVTAAYGVARYLSSGRAGDVHRPKQLSNSWGQTDSKAYGLFLLQSFPGVGPKVAEAIYDHFNGVPIRWAVNAGELALVPGVGRKRAEALCAALAPGGMIRPA